MFKLLFSLILFCIYTRIMCFRLEVASNATNRFSNDSILRIVSGSPANITDVPYVVRITSASSSLCTGAIIHKDWVLTAAHCIVNKDYPEDLEISAGIDDTANIRDAQVRRGKTIHIHDDYWPGKIAKYDVAVIEVDASFVINVTTNVLPLSNDEWPAGEEMYHRPCLVVGWGGYDLRRSKGDFLRSRNVSARHGEEGCACSPSFHNRRLICLEDRGRGICPGDRGGPLVCDEKAVGVVHIIYRPESCSTFQVEPLELDCTKTVAAYTYICPLLDFFHEHVPGVPQQPASCRGSSRLAPNIFSTFFSCETSYLNQQGCVTVERSFNLEKTVDILALADDEWPQNNEKYGRPCSVTSWGAIEIGRAGARKLKNTNITARHGDNGCKCPQTYENKQLICSEETGSGICKGDFGAVLICDNKGVAVAHTIYRPETCKFLQLGNRELNCKKSISVFIYLCPMLDFINKHVPRTPATPEKCAASAKSISIIALAFFVVYYSLLEGTI